MMYHVEWLPSALEDLAKFWMDAGANEREAITAATQLIDQHLSSNPAEEGESRANGRRIAFAPPVWFVFRVLDSDRKVRVIQVGKLRTTG